MGDFVKQLLDLSDFMETVLNPFYFWPDGNEKDDDEFKETNNEFGWNVSVAEITLDNATKTIVEYILFSEKGIVQSHALKVKTDELEYWRYEFLGRELKYSPDPFEPSLEKFLRFFYQELHGNDEPYNIDISLPVAFYEISTEQKIKTIRYALSVNNLYTKPLFYISVNTGGYLLSISDWQSTESKHIAYPTPDHPGSYLLQKFANNGHGNLYNMEKVGSVKEKVLVFKGFVEREVKYYADPVLEPTFRSHGFFTPELRRIINEAEFLLKYIPTVNYHLIKPCNMKCNHCFSDFSEQETDQLKFDEARQIINEISSIKSFRKLNFSGGEPTLFKGIEELVKFAKQRKLETSMVTNGYRLIKSPDLLNSFINHLDLLVLSIDSLDNELNLKIGRRVGNNTISFEDLMVLSEKCHQNDIKIKINTVVTKHNCNQVFADKIAKLQPIRWKIFRMLPIESQNEQANNIHPTDFEFKEFLDRNIPIAEQSKIKVVSENNDEMTGSYLMISPDGRFFNNVDGVHNYSDHILQIGIRAALTQTPLLREMFYKREGDYSCN